MAEQKASKAIAKTGVQGEALPTEHRAEIAKQHTEMAAALWPQKLTLAEKAAVAAVAEAYGLDPLMGELRILGGNLYVTKPGLNRMAYEDANPPVSIQVTPCSEQERKALGLTHDDPSEKTAYQYAFRCELWKQDTPENRPFREWGIASWDTVGMAEKTKNHKTLSATAATRAFCRCIRVAYKIGLPSLEETEHDTANVPNNKGVVNVSPITETQRRKLFAQAKEVNVELDALRVHLENAYGSPHTSELTKDQWAETIEWLQNQAGKTPEAKPDNGEKSESPENGELAFAGERDPGQEG